MIIPIPNNSDIIKGVEFAFILWPIKVIQMQIQKEAKSLRAHIIKQHVKSGHTDHLSHCIEDDCATMPIDLILQD
jgi:hypothetical protein